MQKSWGGSEPGTFKRSTNTSVAGVTRTGCVGRAAFLKALEVNPFPCLFQLLEATCILEIASPLPGSIIISPSLALTSDLLFHLYGLL